MFADLLQSKAYRDLPCGRLAEFRYNHGLTDGEIKPASEVLTKGGGVAVPMSKY